MKALRRLPSAHGHPLELAHPLGTLYERRAEGAQLQEDRQVNTAATAAPAATGKSPGGYMNKAGEAP